MAKYLKLKNQKSNSPNNIYKKRLLQTALFSTLYLATLGLCFLLIEKKGNTINTKLGTLDWSDSYLLDHKFKSLTANEKKGLIFMVSIPDKKLSHKTITFLKKHQIGGIILMGYNIKSPSQLKKLTTELRKKVNPDLLISVDQEGGSVSRIKWLKYASLSPKKVAEKGAYWFAYQVAYTRAKALLDLGINVVLGPVADVALSQDSYVKERCFGSNPNQVAKMVATTVRAHRDAGIITVLKHFPGHGRTGVDSHKKFPVIDLTREELNKNEFKPFRAGIKAGAEMVMMGHIINPSIHPKVPSSLSKTYVNILRKELGFNGIVISDDLNMTGKIKQGIGWGINLSVEFFKDAEERIGKVEPSDETVKRILTLLQKNNSIKNLKQFNTSEEKHFFSSYFNIHDKMNHGNVRFAIDQKKIF